MKSLITVILGCLCIQASTQKNIEITFQPSYDSKCLSMNITSLEQGDILLQFQSYKFYYDSEKLELDMVKPSAKMINSHYSSEIIRHQKNISKPINGPLSFENNMGFVVSNFRHNENDTDYLSMSLMDQIEVAQVCFKQDVDVKDAVLATPQVTGRYGKLFSAVFYESTPVTSLEKAPLLAGSLYLEYIED